MSWWTAASCQWGVPETVCVRDGRGRPQSFLHASQSWRRAGPRGMEDCSPSISLQSEQVPDSDGVGEDGLTNGGVEVHHPWHWQIELLQLPLGSPSSAGPFWWGSWCSDCTRSPDYQSPSCRRTHPHQKWTNEGELQELERLMTGGSAVCVQGEEQRGKNASLRGTGADGPRVRDMFPSFTCCLLSDRKSVIHLQVESGMFSWESVSYSRVRRQDNTEFIKTNTWRVSSWTWFWSFQKFLHS